MGRPRRPPKTNEMTPAQARFMACLNEFWTREGYLPNNRQLARIYGCGASGVTYMLKRLVKKGFLERIPMNDQDHGHGSRGIYRPFIRSRGVNCPHCGSWFLHKEKFSKEDSEGFQLQYFPSAEEINRQKELYRGRWTPETERKRRGALPPDWGPPESKTDLTRRKGRN